MLGVDAALDGVAPRRHVAFRDRQLLPRGYAELLLDDVDPGHRFRDRVLDLQPGVHLDEVERAALVAQELEGPRVPIADRPSGACDLRRQLPARCLVDGHRRGLLQELLVSPLDRALPLSEAEHRPAPVDEHLKLDVARRGQVPFQIEPRIPERRLRLALRGAPHGLEGGRVRRHPHAPTAAPAACLDDHRVADRCCRLVPRGRRLRGFVGSGKDGHAGAAHRRARRHLVPNQAQDGGRRPDERDPPLHAGLRELRALGEESVSGMYGVGAREAGRLDDCGHVEVAPLRPGRSDTDRAAGSPCVEGRSIHRRADGDGVEPQFAAGGDHAQRHLAPVGDENPVEHRAA